MTLHYPKQLTERVWSETRDAPQKWAFFLPWYLLVYRQFSWWYETLGSRAMNIRNNLIKQTPNSVVSWSQEMMILLLLVSYCRWQLNGICFEFLMGVSITAKSGIVLGFLNYHNQ